MCFAGFNHSMYHAFLVLAPFVLVAAFVVIANAIWRRDIFYHFDSGNNADSGLKEKNGDFGPHFSRYQDLAKLIITLSVGAIAFLVNTLIGFKPPPSDFVARVLDATPIVTGMFGSCVTFLIGFLALQTFWYEEYCHSPRHDTYRAWKYAWCTVLGWLGLFAFLLAFAWLGFNLFP